MNETNNLGTGPNYGKFVVDNTSNLGDGRTEGGDGMMGQSKYAGGNGPIYDDPTRDTEDDKKVEVDCEDDSDESQDGMY